MQSFSNSAKPLSPPSPARQVAFHQLLVGARSRWLVDALYQALNEVDPIILKQEAAALIPADVQTILAAAGIRDEHVFPLPCLITIQPTLLGYYRLLLGASQKSFYRSDTGLAGFKAMETSNALSPRHRERLLDLCGALAGPLASLVRQMSPEITLRDVQELPLLTLGAQFQGANNVGIGQQATREVFLAVTEILAPYLTEQEAQRAVISNSAGRQVQIVLKADPDIGIFEEFNGELRAKVAIEIKGGTDMSNVHNRAGEAEKSHQKAKVRGFRDFWTLILKKNVDQSNLRAESPTTTSWFDIAQVVGKSGSDWSEFQSRIEEVVGIPHPEE